uniref:Ribonuclease H-like domain-containing protein n=1 Tax=Tanacetum cinerariifolium TaxID=118510 RepID=A0A699GMB8_TANCI|nr:ribonuclease H-like domain-containing protein [Tanacetum cinerariifolium]
MVTRAKAGISRPIDKLTLHNTTTSPIPKSHIHAFRDPNWQKAMLEEYNALITNGTWVLVPGPANVNIVRSIWLFRHIVRSWLIANGRSQQLGIDCDETFSPVVKPTTIRIVLSLTTPVDTESKLGSDDDPVNDPTLYRSLAGALQYLTSTLVYCDNVSVVYMSTNPVQHQRTKHIEIDIYFVCDFVASGQVRVLHVSSRFQYADIFTQELPFVS